MRSPRGRGRRTASSRRDIFTTWGAAVRESVGRRLAAWSRLCILACIVIDVEKILLVSALKKCHLTTVAQEICYLQTSPRQWWIEHPFVVFVPSSQESRRVGR